MRHLSRVRGVDIDATIFRHVRTGTGDELVSRLAPMEAQVTGSTSRSKRQPQPTPPVGP